MSFTIYQEGLPADLGTCVLDMSMDSRIDRKEEMINAASELIAKNQWVEEKEMHWLILCLDEVVVNAMLHGNEGDPLLPVRLRIFDRSSGEWLICVEDVGEGFVYEDVPSPDNPDSIMLEHGRGLLIMGEWLDDLSYYNGGTSALLRRRKSIP